MDGFENSYLHKEYPKTCAPDDFWGQVKRTVNGKPVSEDQIQMIVDAILDGLQISAADVLLDLCCGNGALTDRIFSRCRGGVGVDFSEPLIAVAKKNFQSRPQRVYELEDVESFLRSTDQTERFNRVLCYGAFQYLPVAMAKSVLSLIHRRLPHVTHMFVGNLPDKTRMAAFFGDNRPAAGIEHDPESPIGIWRTKAEFSALAQESGWNATFAHMPDQFYAARYRYDAILTRRGADSSGLPNA